LIFDPNLLLQSIKNNPFGDTKMTKDELLSKIQSSIDEQQAKLTELKNRAIDESEDAISDIRAAIDDLEPKLEQAKAKALEIADTADDKWDDVKDSLEAGWDEASAKLEKGWDRFTSSMKSLFS
jgi:chromosome segregation ATPase